MDTQAQTAAEAPSTAEAAQGTHHFVITLENPQYGSVSCSGTVTPPPGQTRHDVFQRIFSGLVNNAPQFAGANVLFFSLEPNQL
jgi:hypothetical protein